MCTLLEIMQIIIIIRGAAQDVLERRLNNQYSPRKFRLPSRLFRSFISINYNNFFARWRGTTCSSSDYDRIEMIIRLLSQGGNVFHIVLHCREYSGFSTQ